MRPSHILHLEDDASDAILIQRTLKRAGLDVSLTVATDAREFETAISSRAFDLILSDSCIPGFGGMMALKMVRSRDPGVPFICVSGAKDERSIDDLIKHGATSFVLKSNPAQLIATVRQALSLQELQHEVRRLSHTQTASGRLVTAVQELSLARDFDSIRRIVRHAARELTGADGATLVLRDGDQCHYVDEDAISPLWKGKRFPLSACISGWAMLNRQSVAIEDIYADSRIPADAYRPTFVKSLLMVPIRSSDPIGAIGNYWASPHSADSREIELLEALANTTAVALENVRVYAELEQRVKERTLQLEAANRELETFSFSVSHDLRSPLHSIGAYAELLEDAGLAPTDAERREYLSHIRQQTVRMGRLIEDFLRLAQLTRADLKRESVDLVKIATDLVPSLRETAPGRHVDFVHPPSLPASGDLRLLQAALQNLLSNAWKYTGRVTDAHVELGSIKKENAGEVFFVRDNGAGFDPQYLDKLFTPFQRLHSSKDFPGSGVGLATVQRIIHKHGGRIWAEAKPDAGATFYFTLAPESAG
jgi:signal transduction histidine kinase/DNA-binding response OmpR family regulator